MNRVHHEDVEIINKLFILILAYEQDTSNANEKAINIQYQHWYTHTIEHFRGEEIKMQELQFPAYPMHKYEHDKALDRMDSIFHLWQKEKDIVLLKTYLSGELPAWLSQHIQTMDTVTAHFFHSGVSPCSRH